MRRVALALTALVLSAGAALADPAPQTLHPDLMTVSGRQGLPQAGAQAPRVSLGEVSAASAVTERTHFDPLALDIALTAALERSLRNHAFLSSAGEATPLVAEWSGLDVEQDETGATVTVHLRASGPACLPYEATGRFRSLARTKSGGGRRLVGVLGTVATLGMDGGASMVNQMTLASQENRALNVGRKVGEAEGVAPSFGDTALIQFGASNAVRLALADLLTKLNSSACAVQPSAPSSTGTP